MLDMTATTVPINPLALRTHSAYNQVFESTATDTLTFLQKLNRMLALENANGYTFQASTRAYNHTRKVLENASALLGLVFPTPEFMPDGEGGIDTEWENGTRNLTLSCRGQANQSDFIYWEESGNYDGDEASLELLLEKLKWLNG